MNFKMKKYTAKGLSKLAGVSVRTLHHYDKIGLLKPAIRTEARYRLYGEIELLKLQQILFFKELDFPLKEIIDILDEPDFDLVLALEEHKKRLVLKKQRISVMLKTLDKTMLNLKTKTMITDDQLYEGFPKESRKKVREEAIEQYGKEKVEWSEKHLQKLSKEDFEKLIQDQKDIFKQLFEMSHKNPEAEEVQLETAKHFKNIMAFWARNPNSEDVVKDYRGLAKLYLADERFTLVEGKAQPKFAKFLAEAMDYFAKNL